MNGPPLVSVLMLTYNQEDYIAQAIESVLAQKTNFNFQLVIGEDCSTDGTSEICRKYKNRFPEKIILLLSNANLGLGRNFMRTFNACEGKYLAICEGDDFWIHPSKLQLQVDFLEKNPEFSICFHRIMNYFPEDGSKSLSNPSQKRVTGIVDLSRKNFISNVSCMYRNKLFELPEWFSKISTYDYAMHMLNAQFGKIAYIPKIMAVYRQHKNAIWSRNLPEKKFQIAMDVRKNLIDYFQDKPEILIGLKDAYANNAIAKIRCCKKSQNEEELLKTWKSLLEIHPEWILEKLIYDSSVEKSFYKKIKKIMQNFLTFFRIQLSKLYPLPQLRL